MSEFVKALLIGALAAGAGYVSVLALSAGAGPGAVVTNGWTVWRNPAAPDASPYARVHYLAEGRLPPSHFLEVVYETAEDAQGRALDAACDYLVTGRLPPARWWTLTLRPGDGAARPVAITAHDAIVAPDGRFTLRIARFLRTGNWLPAPRSGAFRLVFRLYGASPLQRERIHHHPMPSVRREGCR